MRAFLVALLVLFSVAVLVASHFLGWHAPSRDMFPDCFAGAACPSPIPHS